MKKISSAIAPKKNIFFLTGENDFSLKRFARKWEQSALKKYGEFSVIRFSFTEKPAAEMLSEMASPPFFGEEKRIFFVDHFPPPPPKMPLSSTEKTASLLFAKGLSTLPEESIVVCISPRPDKRSAAYKTFAKICGKTEIFPEWKRDFSGNMSVDGVRDAIHFIHTYAQENGAKLTDETAKFLLDFCGFDSWKLAREVEKLALFSPQISSETIAQLAIPREEMANFAFSNAVSSGKKEKIFAVLHDLKVSGEAPQAILGRDIIPTIRQLFAVKLISEGEKQTEMGVHPFLVKKLTPLIKKLSRQKIANAHHAVLIIDIEMKTGLLPATPEKNDIFFLAVEKVFLNLFL